MVTLTAQAAATVVAAAGAGALVGALVPLPAHRLSVPYGDPPVAACSACGRPHPPGPAGWVRLGARCPGCRAVGGPSPALVATLAALAAAGLAWRFGPGLPLLAYLWAVPGCALLAAIDLACLRLPLRLVGTTLAGAVGWLAVAAAVAGAWGAFGRALLGGLAFGAGYLVLALLPGGQFGLGDVTLAVPLGVYLAWLNWPTLLLGAVLPFAVNAPVAVWLLLRRRAGRRTELPFGPAMLAGAYLAVVGPAVVVAVLGG